jgi:DNA-binding XRE family transcriptional regulator
VGFQGHPHHESTLGDSPTLELAFKIAAVFEKRLGEVFHHEEQLDNSRSSGSTDAQANRKNST